MPASTFNPRDYVNAWNMHDADKVSECYAENAFVEAPEAPQALRNRDEVRRNVQAWMRAFPDVNADLEHVAQTGQTVALLVHYTGVHTGPLEFPSGKSIPATQKKVDMPVAIFLNLDQQGKIQKERDVYDMASLVGQLGITPEQAGIGVRAAR